MTSQPPGRHRAPRVSRAGARLRSLSESGSVLTVVAGCVLVALTPQAGRGAGTICVGMLWAAAHLVVDKLRHAGRTVREILGQQ